MIEVGAELLVVNSAVNRATPFWEPLIGKKAILVGVGDDGLWDVSIVGSHPLIPGVLSSRFTVVSYALPKSVWRIAWERLAPTIYGLIIIAVVAVVCMLPSCIRGSHG